MKPFAGRKPPCHLAVALFVLAWAAGSVRGSSEGSGPTTAGPSTGASLVLRAKFLAPGSLAGIQNATFPGSIASDRNLGVGSLFSGLFGYPRDPLLTFWAVSDRGPNEDLPVRGETRRTFPLPEFDPTIFLVRVRAGAEGCPEVEIQTSTPLKTSGGAPVTGLPNRPGVDEVPYDWKGDIRLATNMDGLDTEGIVRTPEGDFWLCEEYGPSLLSVAPSGTVKVRYVPAGSGISGTHYPVSETLPAIYARRRANRGFESIAISRDGKRIFAVDFGPATNLLGTKWDDAGTTPSLEALLPEELAARGIVPAIKTLVADIGETVPDAPQKVEGLAILDRWTIAVGNDNEFDIRGFDEAGNRKPKGNQLSELLVLRLPQPLALE